MNKLERKQLNERKNNQKQTRDNMLWVGMVTSTRTNAKKTKALSYRTKDAEQEGVWARSHTATQI
jgi:hypothetical protein